MLPQHVLVLLVAAVSAVPLNINLGAYSPALVVGDGEISLGSAERASELMQTLASGAAAGGNGEQQGQQQEEQPAEQQQEEQPAEQQEEQQEEQPAEEATANEGRAVPMPNIKRAVDESEDRLAAVQEAMQWIKRDLAGFREALGYARDAQKDAPKVELGTGEEGSGVGIIVNAGLNVPANSAANGEQPAGERKAKRGEVVAEESEAPKMTLVAITEV